MPSDKHKEEVLDGQHMYKKCSKRLRLGFFDREKKIVKGREREKNPIIR